MGNNLTAVDLGTNFIPTDIEAGGWHVCAMTDLQEIKCWGLNEYGQLGIGCGWTEQFGDNLPILEFPSDFVPQFMGLGGAHSCFVSMNASLICIGNNEFGQLGYGDTDHRGECGSDHESLSSFPTVDLGLGFEIAQIQMMGSHGCALSTNEELKCWGMFIWKMISFFGDH